MLSGLMSTEDEEEIMKELDDLREQEVSARGTPLGNIEQKQLKALLQLSAKLPDVPNTELPIDLSDKIPEVPTHVPSDGKEGKFDHKKKYHILLYLISFLIAVKPSSERQAMLAS